MKNWMLIVFLLFAAFLGGCSFPRAEGGTPVGLPVATALPEETLSLQESYPSLNLISQWGKEAQASSQFADPEWSASQVTGRPDSPGCGDYQFSWASAASDSIETLEVSYRTPVYPLQITIYESFNPDQVVKVEVYNEDTGGYFTVLQKNPTPVDRPCPFQLVIPVAGMAFKTSLIRITVDQSQLGLGWNEIDAVELVGSLDPLPAEN